MCTIVASTVGVPTPTSACSTLRACFRTCWTVGSSRRAAASEGVDAMIGVGITVAEVTSDDSAVASPFEDRMVGR
jgi:hypothetical protein